MSAFGGIINLYGNERIDALKSMKRSMCLFAGEDWKANLYGGNALLFGGFAMPFEISNGKGRRAAAVFESRRSLGYGAALDGAREAFCAYFDEGISFIYHIRSKGALAIFDIDKEELFVYVPKGCSSRIYYVKGRESVYFSTALCGVAPWSSLGNIESISGGEALFISSGRGLSLCSQ